MTPRGKRGLALMGAGVLATFGLWLAAPGWRGSNFHEVVPGRVFRSGQLTPADLDAAIEAHALKSVINLRGAKPGQEWYEAEAEVLRRHGLRHENLDLPKRLPSRLVVLRLIDLLETLPEPVLLHCKAGSDRSGFASVLVRIVKSGETLGAARSELGLLYGHLPWGAAADFARFFDLYADYLARSGAADSEKTFKNWVETVYVPYNHLAKIETLEFPGRVKAGSLVPVKFRVTNTSPAAWRFSASQKEGIRLGFTLRRDGDTPWSDYHRVGFFNLALPPGEWLDLATELKAPSVPGTYEVKADMVDEHVAWFEDEGSSPVVLQVLVEP